MARGRRAASALLALSLLMLPEILHAHATLLHSEPMGNARLETAPARITLVFNERIETVFHSLHVVNSRGQHIDAGNARVVDGGETLTVPLPSLPPLDAGAYGVFWRISSLDGHQIQGQFGFGVRSDPPSEQSLTQWAPVAGQTVPVWYFPLLKGAGALALSVWLGGIFAWSLVFPPADSGAPPLEARFRKRSFRVACAAAVAYLLAELLWIVGKAASFAGSSLVEAVPAPLQAVLTGSSLGQWWTVRFVLGAMLFLLMNAAMRPGRSVRVAAGLSAVFATAMLGTIALTGHAQTAASAVPAAQAIHWLHLAASAIWVGGLFHLMLAAGLADWRDPGAVEWIGRAAPRFSRVAQVCVAVLALSGIYNTWLHIPSWAAFVEVAYGRVLFLKIIFVAMTLAVATLNWRRVLPELARLRENVAAPRRWILRFQPLLQGELAGAVVILGIVGLLTNLPPASAILRGGAQQLRQRAGDYTVSLEITPNKAGRNTAHITLEDGGGQARTDARRVMLYARSLDMDMGLTTAAAALAPDGTYQAEITLSMAGRWQLSVEVTPADGDAFVAEFRIVSSM